MWERTELNLHLKQVHPKCLVTDRDFSNVPSAQKSSARIRAGENMSRTVKNSPIRGWGGLSKMSKNVHNWIISTRSGFIWFYHLNWPHPLTHPLIHTPTHSYGCLNKSSIFKQNWMISIRSRFIWYLIIWPDPTHWPTEPLIHPHTYHAWGVSTNHKSSNRIELSRLGQDLFNCYSFDVISPIDPPIDPHTHPWVGVCLQIINLQTELNYLN